MREVSNVEITNELRKLLESKSKRQFTDKEISLAVSNLGGFAQTLIKMKMENDKNGGLSR